ncbi:MAG: hypothetical protein FJW88_12225, partial [Actinobacteria bacterium]|nr:hypothetical protein [Actinomycetota bacterium]
MTAPPVDDTLLPSRGSEPTRATPATPGPPPSQDLPPPSPTPERVTEIQRLHAESEGLLAAAERPLALPGHRKKLQAALQAEGEALRAAGFRSYTEFSAAQDATGGVHEAEPSDRGPDEMPAPVLATTQPEVEAEADETAFETTAPEPEPERPSGTARTQLATQEAALAETLAEAAATRREADEARAAAMLAA